MHNECGDYSCFNGHVSARVVTPDAQVKGQRRCYPSRYFYNSKWNTAAVKSLLSQHKNNKVSAPTTEVISRCWKHSDKYFWGGRPVVKLFHNSTMTADVNSKCEECKVESKQKQTI